MSSSKKFVTIALALIASICLAVALFMLPAKSSHADVIEVSEDKYFEIGGGELTGLSEEGKAEIAKGACKIVIPANVTSIADNAFSGSVLGNVARQNIEEIELATGTQLQAIGEKAFTNLTALKSINLNIAMSLKTIQAQAFDGCINLAEITIPQNVTDVGLSAFANCSGLKTINYLANKAAVQPHAFELLPEAYAISNVTVNIGSASAVVNRLPQGLFCSVDGDIVKGHKGVTAVNFVNVKPEDGEGYNGWGADLFRGCTSLATVTFDSTCVIRLINTGAFEGCTSLNSIVGLDKIQLQTIKTGAFRNCTSLFRVIIGENVSSIEDYAFEGCDRLIEVVDLSKSITIEKGATSYGMVAFYALAVYNEDTTKIENVDGFNFIDTAENGGTVKYLIGYTGTATDLKLPSRYTGFKIYNKAFYNNTKITSIDLEKCGNADSGIMVIGNAAFAGCTSLRNITFPSSISEIGDNALQGCTALTNVTFVGNAPTTIKSYTFSGCTSLARIDLKNTRVIELHAFENCSSLSVVNFSATGVTSTTTSTLETIGGSAFLNCIRLSTIKIPETVTRIDTDAFKGCYSLSIVYLPADKTEALQDKPVEYGTDVFDGCSDNLILISASRDQYFKDVENERLEKYSDKLTYMVKVKLHYDDGNVLPDSSGQKYYTVNKLYGRDAGYSQNADGLNWTVTSSMPVQNNYSMSVWYDSEDYTNKVSLENLTSLLNEDKEEISLYAHYVQKPALTARIGSEAAVYEQGMEYGIDDVLINCLKLNGQPISNPKLDDAFRYTITAHYYVNGNKSEWKWDPNTSPISMAGKYTLQIELESEDYGVWAEDFTIDFEIKPLEIDIASIGLNWETTNGGALNATAETLYFYENDVNVPFTEQQEHEGQIRKQTQVLNSYVIYTGNQVTIEISGNQLEKYADMDQLSYSNNYGTNAGTYTATATIIANNNYKFTYIIKDSDYDKLKAQGLSFSVSESVVEVTKVWYIAKSSSNHLMSVTGEGEVSGQYTIENILAGRKYNSDTIGDNLPKEPGLSITKDGNTAETLITFALKLDTGNGAKDITAEPQRLSEFSRYFNSSMPAGTYTVTFYIGNIMNGGIIETPGKPEGQSFEFVVGDATLTNAEKYDTTLVFGLDATINVLYSGDGNPVFAPTEVRQNNNNFRISVLYNDMQVSSRLGIWANSAYDEYYKQFEIAYFVKEGAKTNYVNDPIPTVYYTADKYNNPANVTGAIPTQPGTYTVFYKIYAPNYYGDTMYGMYEMNIQRYADVPSMSSDGNNVDFSGSSVIAEVLMRLENKAWDCYNIYTLREDDIFTPQEIIAEYGYDTYVNQGKHYVFLQIKPEMAKYAIWSDAAKAMGELKRIDNGRTEILVIAFEIVPSGKSVKSPLSVSKWEYGKFTRDNNAPNWAVYGYEDYNMYEFILVSKNNDNLKYYFYGNENTALGSKPGFNVAPAGEYYLIANVLDATDPELVLVSSSIEIVIEKASPEFVEAPFVSSWTYGEYTAGKAVPSQYAFAFTDADINKKALELIDEFKYCTESGYRNGSYLSITQLLNAEGQLPVGTYYLVFTLKNTVDSDTDGFDRSWRYGVRFEVLMPSSYEWAYGEFKGEKINESQFGSGYTIVYQNGTTWVAKEEFPYYSAATGEFTVGEYVMGVLPNGARIPTRTAPVVVKKAANSWTTLPSIVGWEYGNYVSADNSPKAAAAFGTITYVITDEDGNEYTLQDANELEVGRYTLTVKASGSDNWEELTTVVYFSVIGAGDGNEGAITGISVALIICSVIAVSLAVAGIAVIMLNGKKPKKHKPANKATGRK